MPRQPTRTDYIVLFALGALWGSSFGAIKIALHGVTPLTVMSVRILLAGAALLLLILGVKLLSHVEYKTGSKLAGWLFSEH